MSVLCIKPGVAWRGRAIAVLIATLALAVGPSLVSAHVDPPSPQPSPGGGGSEARVPRSLATVQSGGVALSLPPTLAQSSRESLTDTRLAWPSAELILQTLLLRDYNTRLVVLSTAILGAAAGMIGSFLLLRKRSLIGDVLSHATLPGIALAFLVMVAAGGSGKWMPGLLLGAAAAGLLGVGAVLIVRRFSRLKDDAAMGLVLSVFFGAGVALLGIIQGLPGGSKSGLESFIYGKTAAMVWNDFLLIITVTAASLVACVLLFKEFALLCFDEAYAHSQGWPVTLLDMLMLALVTAVTVIGLQSVGLILIIALLITPPAAARFWTEGLRTMTLLAATIGALSGWLGATLSALLPRLPAGAIIVVVAAALFVLSMLAGTSRGVLLRVWRAQRLNRRVAAQHLLRAFYEVGEPEAAGRDAAPPRVTVPFERLLAARSWSAGRLRRHLRRARRDGLVETVGGDAYRLTPAGAEQAARHVRNHRLWELYLIAHADVAPSHVDRDADQVEHVIGPEMVRRLEAMVAGESRDRRVPPSPHAI